MRNESGSRAPCAWEVVSSCYASRLSWNNEVSGAPSGLAGCDSGRRHSDRRFALFCRGGSVACQRGPRYHRRGDSDAVVRLALGLSAWTRFGIDSGSGSISYLDRRSFLRDQPESPAGSRVEIVEAASAAATQLFKDETTWQSAAVLPFRFYKSQRQYRAL